MNTSHKKKKIGIVTGGGDCPGLNAVIRAIVKAAALQGWESIGIHGGYDGLMSPVKTSPLAFKDMDGLLVRGGTILGTASSGLFSAKTGQGKARQIDPGVMARAKTNFDRLGLSALVAIGGDGTLTVALQMHENGWPVVGIPKTIDNDLDATLMTFGFDTAVSCAVDALDRLHSTAQSHNRVMVLEVMGRYAGWIATHAGLAGGADVILIPEIPFNFESVCQKIRDREAEGKAFTIVIAAEGARQAGRDFTTDGASEKDREIRLGGIGQDVAKKIEALTGKETRSVVLGHLQRGGTPTQFDRQLCTRFGVYAVQMIARQQFGMMAALTGTGIAPVTLADAVHRIRTVPEDGELVMTARALGISFGDTPPKNMAALQPEC
jgi:ATP-dependent phosphofructokinase / diphosphate-dependent phosphofructokinase